MRSGEARDNQRYSLSIENESENNIEKPRFREQSSCCDGQILSEFTWGGFDFREEHLASLDYCHEIFGIMAGMVVSSSPSAERFQLSGH